MYVYEFMYVCMYVSVFDTYRMHVYKNMVLYSSMYVFTCMYVVSALETEVEILKQKNERDCMAWKVDLTEMQALVAEKTKAEESAHESNKDISHQVPYMHIYTCIHTLTYIYTYNIYNIFIQIIHTHTNIRINTYISIS